MTYRGFVGYSEISNLNPQSEYFHKKINFQLFKKCYFWGCDVENWVWTKLDLWICPILWMRTFLHFRPYCMARILFRNFWIMAKNTSDTKGSSIIPQTHHKSWECVFSFWQYKMKLTKHLITFSQKTQLFMVQVISLRMFTHIWLLRASHDSFQLLEKY